MRRHGGIFVIALVAACGPHGGDDAGTDAGAELDAEVDAGVDAGPFDAGPPPDGGVPDTVEMAAAMTATELAAVEATLPSVPMAAIETAAFLDLGACMTGIDAIIGEDGLNTLALGDGALRALADFQMAGRLLTLLDLTLNELMIVPGGVDAVVTAATQLRAALATYRDELGALYRTRRDADPLFVPVPGQYTSERTVISTGQVAQLDAVVEYDATIPQAGISWVCTNIPTPNEVWIVDLDTGVRTPAPSTPFQYPLDPTRTAQALRLELVGLVRPAVVDVLGSCAFGVFSHRNLRAGPRALTGGGLPLTFATMSYQNALVPYQMAIMPIFGTPLAISVDRLITMLHDILAPILSLVFGGTPFIAYEDTDLVIRSYPYVDAMLTTALSNPQVIAQPNLRDNVDILATAGRDLVNAVRGL